jgi:hypothetical protein
MSFNFGRESNIFPQKFTKITSRFNQVLIVPDTTLFLPRLEGQTDHASKTEQCPVLSS